MPPVEPYDITVASTTESQADVDAAAGVTTVVEPEQQTSVADGESQQAETAADSETATNQDGERKDKGKGGFQKRIDKLTRQNAELRARLDEIDSRTTPAKTAAAAPAQTPASADKRPEPKDFKTYEEFTEALADWKIDQKLAAKESATEKAQSDAALKETFDAYNSRIDQAREKYDDWDATVAQTKVPLYEGVKLAIIEMDNGPDVAYYIGKHPELAEELMTMSPLQAIMETGRLSVFLSAGSPQQQTSAPAKSVTKAPAPITPTRSSSTRSQRALDDDGISTDEYIKRRNAGESN